MSLNKIHSLIRGEKFYNLLVVLVLILFIWMIVDNVRSHIQFKDLIAQNEKMSSQIELLTMDISSTTTRLAQSIDETKNSITSDIERERQNVSKITAELGVYKEEVGELSGTLGDIEKLSQIDEELLQKYSKVAFLNEHFKPAQLLDVPEEYTYNSHKTLLVHSKVHPYLIRMFKAAHNDGIKLYASSAFRSFNEQGALKNQYTVLYGAGTANQFSADQGYSEHQLGTTLDFITTGIGGTLEGFDQTDAYQWMLNFAHKYGFVLSYPEDNEYYVFEPWHWRFVGIELAQDLKSSSKSFYDLEQRDIDEYLISIFD